ncbi:MAG: ankyrin repeat domain-containing protein [Sphingobacteriales bacterium]|nr:MAG: ankyrin repeat domain-containing protein [Sphingobacteriales bacterium]
MEQNLLEDLVINNNEEGIRTLLLQNPNLVYQKTSYGVSLIMLSCYYKKPTVTNILIEFADLDIFEAAATGKFDVLAHHIFKKPERINDYSEDGFTPLGLAAYFGNDEIARYLVLKGADVNLTSNNGYFISPLHSAIAGNYTQIAKMLIQNGALINCVQKTGITPLHSAAENGNIEIIILLLEKGADVTIRMEGGKLPCTLAQEKGFLEIAEILGV